MQSQGLNMKDLEASDTVESFKLIKFASYKKKEYGPLNLEINL